MKTTDRLTALEECRIGADLAKRFDEADELIAHFVAGLTKRIYGQLHYNALTNVPEGILKRNDIAEHAIKRGVVSAIGALVNWDCDAAIEMAADILEDVNCHTEAAELRGKLSSAS